MILSLILCQKSIKLFRITSGAMYVCTVLFFIF